MAKKELLRWFLLDINFLTVNVSSFVLQTVEILDYYGLSKEDFNESLRELQLKVENDPVLSGWSISLLYFL
jgi:hypothetical protein